ncbi:MAG: CopG family ribbon-helix-helix protein [Promethearchaeota archaeon]
MTKKTPKKKSNFLGFRLSEETLYKLDLLAKQDNKTRGLVAKDAIEQWLNLELFNQTNEMIMISKTVFSKILSRLDEEELNVIAKDSADLFSNIMKFLVAKTMNDKSLKTYAIISINFFGKNGLKWFNTLDIQIQDNTYIFRGLHDLDEVFSHFFSKFYKYLLSEHFNLDFIIKMEEKTSNLIHLDFNLK